MGRVFSLSRRAPRSPETGARAGPHRGHHAPTPYLAQGAGVRSWCRCPGVHVGTCALDSRAVIPPLEDQGLKRSLITGFVWLCWGGAPVHSSTVPGSTHSLPHPAAPQRLGRLGERGRSRSGGRGRRARAVPSTLRALLLLGVVAGLTSWVLETTAAITRAPNPTTKPSILVQNTSRLGTCMSTVCSRPASASSSTLAPTVFQQTHLPSPFTPKLSRSTWR